MYYNILVLYMFAIYSGSHVVNNETQKKTSNAEYFTHICEMNGVNYYKIKHWLWIKPSVRLKINVCFWICISNLNFKDLKKQCMDDTIYPCLFGILVDWQLNYKGFITFPLIYFDHSDLVKLTFKSTLTLYRFVGYQNDVNFTILFSTSNAHHTIDFFGRIKSFFLKIHFSFEKCKWKCRSN